MVAATEEQDLPRRDQLLEDLRTLATTYPEDVAVREWLSTGLFNTMNAAVKKQDLPRRDQLLEDLRTLATMYPDDAFLQSL